MNSLIVCKKNEFDMNGHMSLFTNMFANTYFKKTCEPVHKHVCEKPCDYSNSNIHEQTGLRRLELDSTKLPSLYIDSSLARLIKINEFRTSFLQTETLARE